MVIDLALRVLAGFCAVLFGLIGGAAVLIVSISTLFAPPDPAWASATGCPENVCGSPSTILQVAVFWAGIAFCVLASKAFAWERGDRR